jgi:hypothetical protein
LKRKHLGRLGWSDDACWNWWHEIVDTLLSIDMKEDGKTDFRDGRQVLTLLKGLISMPGSRDMGDMKK